MALQTITLLTLTQPDTVSAKVNFSFTATDADNDLLGLVYEWKLSTDSVWTAATTTAPATVNATAGGVSVNGVWNLDADYTGTVQSATFNLRVTSTKAAIPATGSLTAIAANVTTGIKDGDTVTVGGKTFEFTVDGTPTGTNIGVPVTATSTNAQVKTALIASINATPDATVGAVSGAGQLITLTAKVGGVAGNVAITQSISNSATLTPVGMANGVDAQIVAATGNITGASGSVGEAVVTLPVDRDPNTVQAYVLDQFGVYGAGVLPQAYLKRTIAYECLDILRAGTRAKFELVADRAGLHARRGVLISVAEWNRIRGSASKTIVLKSKQWFANYANKALSQNTFFANGTQVYAISDNSTIVNGVVQQVVIAYLLAGSTYAELAN